MLRGAPGATAPGAPACTVCVACVAGLWGCVRCVRLLPSPPNLAHNFPRSVFDYAHKRWNCKGPISKLERVAGELRATLLGNHESLGHKRPGLLRTTLSKQTVQKSRPLQATRHHWCGGRRRDQRAWLRCPWAVAGPSRASRRRAERSSRRGRLAGGPPPTGTPSNPAQQGTPSSPAQQATGYTKGAGTEVPAPCRFTQPLPRRGLRPDDRQSWRRRRIHRNMPPTTAAPRPAPPIRPSKPVRARPFFGLVAGTSGAT